MALTMDKITFNTIDECIRLRNGTVELVVSTAFGPRVLFYGFEGEQNFFAIFDRDIADRDKPGWRSYGGHRLWHAPEVVPRTYYPDNSPVPFSWDGEALRLGPVKEDDNGLEKYIVIRLSEDGSGVAMEHSIVNRGEWDIELAAWALSVMAPGGRLVIPQEKYRPHPDYLSPARPLVLWHFTAMNDPRFTWGERYIQMRQDDSRPAKLKFGVCNTKGWAAYSLGEQLFIKEHPWEREAPYADMGCNAEFYTEPGFLEIESLSPLRRLETGKAVTHKEQWSLHRISIDEKESSLDRIPGLVDAQ